MSIFDQRDSSLRDTSLDFKLMFTYHICMMVMFGAGQGGLSVRFELLVTAMLVTVLVAVAVRHRRKCGWRWPGVEPVDLLGAVGTVAFVAFFLFSATPLFPPTDGKALPWYLVGLGIGSFGVLSSLHIAYGSETAFLKQCHVLDSSGQEATRVSELPEPTTAIELPWKKRIRIGWMAMFMLVWAVGVLSFYSLGVALKEGTQVPTSTHTEPLDNHGKTVFITPAEKSRIDQLQRLTWVGFPSLIVSGLVLHFIVGVKIFDTRASRRGA